MESIKPQEQLRLALNALFAAANARAGELLVVGCSTSEVMGKRIGSASNADIAAALVRVLLQETQRAGLFLAVQGCEHINRCLCVSRECVQNFDLAPVWVTPWLHAGGACVTEAFAALPDAVMVEDLRSLARMGVDIGGTLIGMHLRPVAVPLRCEARQIGEASLVMAYSRPKYVGGPRTRYDGGGDVHG